MNTTIFFTVYAALFIIIFLIQHYFGKRSGSHQYDERQTLAIGRSYKYAFFALIAYFTLILVTELIAGNELMSTYMLTLLGICMGVLVFGGSCILQDAYVAPKTSPRSAGLCLGCIGLLNTFAGISNLRNGGVKIVDGKLIALPANLLVGLTLLLLLLMFIGKAIMNSREED